MCKLTRYIYALGVLCTRSAKKEQLTMIEKLDWDTLLLGLMKLSVGCLTFSVVASTGQVIEALSWPIPYHSPSCSGWRRSARTRPWLRTPSSIGGATPT